MADNEIRDNTGWFEFISATAATTHIAYVQEDGSVYLPEGRDVVDQDDFTYAAARGKVHRLVHADEFAGCRPPARVIEKAEALADEATGTVIRSRNGDIASVDHGPNGNWLGLGTQVHFLGPGPTGWLSVADMTDPDMAGSLPWTVLWEPKEGSR